LSLNRDDEFGWGGDESGEYGGVVEVDMRIEPRLCNLALCESSKKSDVNMWKNIIPRVTIPVSGRDECEPMRAGVVVE
jgi:hypothetical protein